MLAMLFSMVTMDNSDGQVVCLYADKAYDGAYGGEGYTSMKIEIVSSG
jgi:hypothetical protein